MIKKKKILSNFQISRLGEDVQQAQSNLGNNISSKVLILLKKKMSKEEDICKVLNIFFLILNIDKLSRKIRYKPIVIQDFINIKVIETFLFMFIFK